MLDDLNIVWDRTIEPGPFHGRSAVNRTLEVFGHDLAIDITPVQTMMLKRRLHDGHRRVFHRRHRKIANQFAEESLSHGVVSLSCLVGSAVRLRQGPAMPCNRR